MEIILLENIANLGDLGEQVTVKAGFGRNFLIPQKKAVPATRDNIADFESRRAELEAIVRDQQTKAIARKAEIESLSITLTVKAGEEGKLFGSVTVRDIADAVTDKGVVLENSEVRLPEGPIREIGEYEVDVHLGSDVDAIVKVSVIAEE
ncbi:MAG: 50S ribosomal protein L9 [Proteobacteria bacterium]|nr:50S ribosomal protein L9 [Pseudomonadota bacterium]